MAFEKSHSVQFVRYDVLAPKPFSDVLQAIHTAMGRPEIGATDRQLASSAEWEAFLGAAAGGFTLSPRTVSFELVGVNTKGNKGVEGLGRSPVSLGNSALSVMVRAEPVMDTAAPAAILIFEADDGVHVRYDALAGQTSDDRPGPLTQNPHPIEIEVLELIRTALQT